jgi:hypothetical protein
VYEVSGDPRAAEGWEDYKNALSEVIV